MKVSETVMLLYILPLTSFDTKESNYCLLTHSTGRQVNWLRCFVVCSKILCAGEAVLSSQIRVEVSSYSSAKNCECPPYIGNYGIVQLIYFCHRFFCNRLVLLISPPSGKTKFLLK